MTHEIRRVAQHAALMSLLQNENLSEALDERLGDYRIDVDLMAREIVFSGNGDEVVGRAEFIASVAMRPSTLLWAWAPQFADFVGAEHAVAAFPRFGAEHGLGQFTTEEVPYQVDERPQDEIGNDLAHDAGQCAVEFLGPSTPGGYSYTYPVGGGSRAAIYLSGLSLSVPPVTVRDVGTKLPRLLLNRDIDDLAWSLDGLVRLNPGWTVAESVVGPKRTFVVSDPGAGQSIDIGVEYTEHGLLKSIDAVVR